jgi:hypothetical protein
MSLPEVYIFAGWSGETHYGIDIAGPHGTPHRSPDNCTVSSLYLQEDGGQGMLLRCPRLPPDKVSLHHGDFSINDYETLRWYGIPIDTFFHEDGAPKLGFFSTEPAKNKAAARGADLHFYMACTGHCGLVHTHVGSFIWANDQWYDGGDPAQFLDCSQ